MLFQCGGTSPDSPRGLLSHHPNGVRGNAVSFLPYGDESLFHYSAFSDTTLVGRWKHPITAGQGLKSRLLDLAFASMGGEGATMFSLCFILFSLWGLNVVEWLLPEIFLICRLPLSWSSDLKVWVVIWTICVPTNVCWHLPVTYIFPPI